MFSWLCDLEMPFVPSSPATTIQSDGHLFRASTTLLRISGKPEGAILAIRWGNVLAVTYFCNPSLTGASGTMPLKANSVFSLFLSVRSVRKTPSGEPLSRRILALMPVPRRTIATAAAALVAKSRMVHFMSCSFMRHGSRWRQNSDYTAKDEWIDCYSLYIASFTGVR